MKTSEKLFDSISHLSNDDLEKLAIQISRERHKRKSCEIQEWVNKVNDLFLHSPVEIVSEIHCFERIMSVYYDEDEDVIKTA